MNDSKTPKIVVGVTLVVAYAAGLSYLTLRDKHDLPVADATSAQMVAAPAAPAPVIAESATALASTDAVPAAEAPVVAPAPVAPVAPAKAPEAKRPQLASEVKPRMEDVPVAALPSPRLPASDAEAGRSNAGTNAVSEFTTPAEAAPAESVTSTEDVPAVDTPNAEETPAPADNN